MAAGVVSGLAIGYMIGRYTSKYGAAKPQLSTEESVRLVLEQLEDMKGRLEFRLTEVQVAMEDEQKQAIERKSLGDRNGAIGCLARKRNLRKDFLRIQGLVTSIYGHIVHLEAKETHDEVFLRVAESEVARVLQLEDIEGDITDYRIANFLDLKPRPPTARRTLARSFSIS
eukprot:GEMP01090349.1.p1 GENE.GEMP01090349.1~~GEMP01090349.1.p1  ORF type:complete len:182 (+),score=27.85 GEMP01090349.1:34-546(+)